MTRSIIETHKNPSTRFREHPKIAIWPENQNNDHKYHQQDHRDRSFRNVGNLILGHALQHK